MKIRTLTIIMAFCTLTVGTVKADNVDIQKAKEVGAYFFTQVTGAKNAINADKLQLVHQFDNPTMCVPALYAFNVGEEGYVVVSASDCVEPILAYAPEGRLDWETLNPACRYILECYAKVVADNQNHNVEPLKEVANQWNELVEHTYTFTPDKGAVLVKSKWGQGDPDIPTYNVFCPQISGKPCLTGCVATAMASIIHYWKYPEEGGTASNPTASTSFNNNVVRYNFRVDSNKFIYDSMPNQINYYSPWSNKRAIGKLMFACGVTVKMGWGLDASGTQSSLVPEGLKKYFRYSDSTTYIERVNRFDYPLVSDEEWIAMLHNELDNHSRPVYYSAHDAGGSGRDAGGHAFVIAGTSNSDQNKFYVRWGWDGGSDGFYTLAPMSSMENTNPQNPTYGYQFRNGHAMVYRIYPKTLAIDETSVSFAPGAWPNPTTEYLTIPGDQHYNMKLTVYSLDGKMVDQQVIPAGTTEYRLDVRNYPAGTYVYRLDGNAYKFIVQ